MRTVPSTGLRYWTAISTASVFGANLGDFVSHDLHMGHLNGLPPLALLMAAILWVERRAGSPTEAYYWLAIVMVRTAATNLADLATHDLKLGYGALSVALVLLLGALQWRARSRAAAMPAADGRFWAGMLMAGTLGTVLGDAASHSVGVAQASGALCVALSAVFALRRRDAFATVGFYWITVVAVRTAGTSVGDYLADTVSLEVSLVASGLLLVAILAFWQHRAIRLGMKTS